VSTLIAITTSDQDALIFHRGLCWGSIPLYQLGEGCVALYEHIRIKWHIEAFRELSNALRLVFASTIGQEDEGYAVALQTGKCFVSVRKGLGAAQENAIYTGMMSVKRCTREELERTRMQRQSRWFSVS